MRVIVLGAGRVGSTLAENLSREGHDITMIDKRSDLLQELQDRLDIRTIIGHASHPTTLREAGAESADMIVAVTDSDEVNMVACQTAYSLFDIHTKIARVRSQDYFVEEKLFGDENMPIDVFIRPEQLVINYVKDLIEYPNALQVLNFADGRLKMVAMKPFYGGALLGKPLSKIHELLPDINLRIVAIFRENESIELNDETTIDVGDEIFFLAPPRHVQAVMGAFRKLDDPYAHIMIAGGGNIGSGVAKVLEGNYQVKIIEQNAARSRFLAEALTDTTVLNGDATDEELLISENIEHMDMFCAMTNNDEDNILSCMLAKRFGAHQTMALINRPAYVDLIDTTGINIAISPEEATTSSILAHIRSADVVNVHSLRRGAAEAIEAIAHGDKKTSKVVGRKISELKLPKSITVGAIVRGDKVIMPNEESTIIAEDHVIVFLADKKQLNQVESMFQVK